MPGLCINFTVSFQKLIVSLLTVSLFFPNKPFWRWIAVLAFLRFAGFLPVTPLTSFVHLAVLKPPPANRFPRKRQLSCFLLASGQPLTTLGVWSSACVRFELALPTSHLKVPSKVCFLAGAHSGPGLPQIGEFRKQFSTFDNIAVQEVFGSHFDPEWSRHFVWHVTVRGVELRCKFCVEHSERSFSLSMWKSFEHFFDGDGENVVLALRFRSCYNNGSYH